MKFWRTALACAALCSLLFTGCASPAGETAAEPSGSAATAEAQAAMSLQIPCIAGEYNPYLSAHTVTRQNAMLLFEPLTRIGPDMELEYRLAERVTSSGGVVTIILRTGCTFADGSALTGADVAASLLAAKNSAAYGGRFTHVTDVQAQGHTVTVTLDSPDSLFAYLLDIPVLRMDEVGIRQPTPCGRYTYGPNNAALVKNPLAPFPESGPDTIDLTPVTSHAELVSGLAMGSLDLYASEETSTAGGGITSGETYYKTNQLVFLGVNAYAANPLCNTAAGRSLLSALVDRTQLAARCYDSRANVATGVLNRFYACARGVQVIAATADAAALEPTMAQLGYAWDEAAGLYTDGSGKPASVRLLVYGGNSYKRYTAAVLQQMWAEYGIQVTVEEADGFEDYLAAVQRGEFELYIGEVKLYNNIDMSVFWAGEARVGLAPSEELLAAYAALRADAATADVLEQTFAAEMPFIPLLWKNGAVTASRRITGLTPSVSDIFYSLEQLAPADR